MKRLVTVNRPLAPSQRIIVPLDVPDASSALALVDRLPQVKFWKVGLELFIASGSTVLPELKARGTQVFLDLKLHDIPNTVAGGCRSAAALGIDILTLHAAAGREALQAAQKAVTEAADATGLVPPQLVAITLLTSISARALAFDLKVSLELPDYVLMMALLAQESGLSGVVCSPQEARQLRQACGDEFLLICPGVRPTWSDSGDQQRTLTPIAAIQAGADYLVIGRPITSANNPAVAFDRICDEIA
ncbi:MAG: orotidine-5'-phosphate decarboxylase, partial [Cyanobacteria bacterium]|nr:orotidine-5'-phosphate decarboxylase [Cyanobacteriota bacterium]MDW8202636.1 orotidine-5'-phosphate decarboxylase [Cyanobacteriota bacterium SKYGB_h_bin112]